MAGRISVVAHLDFEVEVAGRGVVRGTVRGHGQELTLEVDRPDVFAGRRDAASLEGLASGLARRELRLRVLREGIHLVTLGATRAPWWHRRATGSPHIRLGSLRGVWTPGLTRLTRGAPPVLPDSGLVPAATLLPVAPTFLRRGRRRVTTTHAPPGGGNPRLVVVARDHYLPGERQPIHWLTGEKTTLGTDPACDIVLPGLAGRHAEISHDVDDEYVVRALDPDTRVNGARVGEKFLRTGSRLQVGRWTLAYSREEHADHGRPHGGRIGGELGRQQPQPPRRRLQADGAGRVDE